MPAYKDNNTGNWFIKFYYTDWQGIKQQKWKRGFATKKEALAFERDFLEKQSANPDMTLQNLFELYMEDMTARLKPSTILTKKNIYRTHILPFFGKKPVNEIKASDVRRWQNQLMNSKKLILRQSIISLHVSSIMPNAFTTLTLIHVARLEASVRQKLMKWTTGLMMSISHSEKV